MRHGRAFTDGRRKGGSVPYRRPSRRRVAEAGADLVYRVFSAALTSPELLDTARLQALVDLAPLMLKALERASPQAGTSSASLAIPLPASENSKP